MALKGLTRSGEAYCLACHQMVEPEAKSCPGCLSELTESVKAFACPKCQTVIALGDPVCPTCGLKFKVKTLKPKDPAKDDQFLMKLIQWGKAPGEGGVAPAEGQASAPAQATEAPPSSEQLIKLTQLKQSINELMANRSEMLERMQKRFAEEKQRLNAISDGSSPSTATQAEAEIMALADEMADITMLQAHMEMLSDEISKLMESVEVSEPAKERGLAAKALRKKLDAKEKELAELKDREEQLAKKEEMVDRKIQGYAQKKKQLDEQEADLQLKLARLSEERAELDLLRSETAGAKTQAEIEQAESKWAEERKRLRGRLVGLGSKLPAEEGGSAEAEIAEAEKDIDTLIADLEAKIGSLMSEKAELQGKIGEATAVDEDLRRLLKVLDQMLGELPEELIERFSKSEDFSLYEKVLDKFKV